MESPVSPRNMGEQFYWVLGDLEFSPTSGFIGPWETLNFHLLLGRAWPNKEFKVFYTIFWEDKGQSFLKFVWLLQVKFNFSIENNFSE